MATDTAHPPSTSSTTTTTLYGSCFCGRNQYEIDVPPATSDDLPIELHFDNSATSRHTHASPLTVYVSAPLALYHSFTHAFYPDETHATIRRTYDVVTSSASTQRRTFCGFCGTHFSAWDDAHPGSRERMRVALESLKRESVELLYELGVLTDGEEEEGGRDDAESDEADEGSVAVAERGRKTVVTRHTGGEGAPWFEEMIEDSALGRIRRTHGGSREDGGLRVEWSVVEMGPRVEGELEDAESVVGHRAAKRRKPEDEEDDGNENSDVHMS